MINLNSNLKQYWLVNALHRLSDINSNFASTLCLYCQLHNDYSLNRMIERCLTLWEFWNIVDFKV
jgi:hypothetical protein